MTVESGISFISQLNESYPRRTDLLKEGDDHIRLVKQVLKLTMPNFDRAVNISASSLNNLNTNFGLEADTTTLRSNFLATASKTYNFANNQLKGVANPTDQQDVVTLNFLNNGGAAAAAYPVNSIYITTDVRNPNAIMGFGTWVAFAAGRVLIGSGTTTDARAETRAFTVNQTGGEFSHVLTVPELPAHNHAHTLAGTANSAGGHTHRGKYRESNISLDGGGSSRRLWDADDSYSSSDSLIETSGAHTHTVTISGSISNTGSGTAHNNLQPFVVVNMWRRTA